jgi:hypothetical protein
MNYRYLLDSIIDTNAIYQHLASADSFTGVSRIACSISWFEWSEKCVFRAHEASLILADGFHGPTRLSHVASSTMIG